jgi:hypothetical protein
MLAVTSYMAWRAASTVLRISNLQPLPTIFFVVDSPYLLSMIVSCPLMRGCGHSITNGSRSNKQVRAGRYEVDET